MNRRLASPRTPGAQIWLAALSVVVAIIFATLAELRFQIEGAEKRVKALDRIETLGQAVKVNQEAVKVNQQALQLYVNDHARDHTRIQRELGELQGRRNSP